MKASPKLKDYFMRIDYPKDSRFEKMTQQEQIEELQVWFRITQEKLRGMKDLVIGEQYLEVKS